jgi:uncharacterized protein (TIGR02646 family)
LRFVDTGSLDPQVNWRSKAKRLTDELLGLPRNDVQAFKAARDEVFRDSCWGDLKDSLSVLLDGKCWYCEAKVDREYGAVDHFRPKGSVLEDETHQGYWWLTYDYTNYRYSCTICNSPSKNRQGKHNQFPLLKGSGRAYTPTDSIASEQPVLLDPTNPLDIGLILYDEDGRPQSTYKKETDEVRHERALESIRIYYLNKLSTCKRRKELMQDVDDAVNTVNQIQQAIPQAPELSQSVERLKEKIAVKVKFDAEFSTASASALMFRRGDSPWVEDILKQGGFLV